MDIAKSLDTLWQDYLHNLPEEEDRVRDVLKRGYGCIRNEKKDILITGINPSFRGDATSGNNFWELKQLLDKDSKDKYWSTVRKMLLGERIDLRDRADYLDIFYYRETDQTFLRKELLSSPEGMRFVAEQLRITMYVVEHVIQPKLIIVKNKESWVYWGKEAETKGWVWMGYRFSAVKELPSGSLYRIEGLIDNKPGRTPQIL